MFNFLKRSSIYREPGIAAQSEAAKLNQLAKNYKIPSISVEDTEVYYKKHLLPSLNRQAKKGKTKDEYTVSFLSENGNIDYLVDLLSSDGFKVKCDGKWLIIDWS